MIPLEIRGQGTSGERGQRWYFFPPFRNISIKETIGRFAFQMLGTGLEFATRQKVKTRPADKLQRKNSAVNTIYPYVRVQ